MKKNQLLETWLELGPQQKNTWLVESKKDTKKEKENKNTKGNCFFFFFRGTQRGHKGTPQRGRKLLRPPPPPLRNGQHGEARMSCPPRTSRSGCWPCASHRPPPRPETAPTYPSRPTPNTRFFYLIAVDSTPCKNNFTFGGFSRKHLNISAKKLKSKDPTMAVKSRV